MRTGGQDIFTFHMPTKIIHGAGSVEGVGREFKSLGCTKALVVTDKGVRAAGLLEGVLASLGEKGIPHEIFDEVEEDPGGATVARGAELALREGCDGVIVIGGGSPICAGRGIGVVVTNGGRIEQYAGIDKASKPPLPLIAIPTTAGSGAEVSQFILLKNDDTHEKMVVGSALYFPKIAILDPLLLRNLPFRQAAISGVDALSHAIESYFTTTATPITDTCALQAIRLLYENLGPAATSDNLNAKEACLLGSSLANIACGNTRLGLTHAMTTPLEGLFGVPHGVAIGVLLPHVMEFNSPADYSRFANLARLLGVPDHKSAEELARGGIRAVKRLFMTLGFPRKFSSDQVDPAAISRMTQITMGGLYGGSGGPEQFPPNAVLPSVNLRKATVKDLTELYERTFEEWQL